MVKLSKVQVDLLRRINAGDKRIRSATVFKLVDAGMLVEVSDPDWTWRSRKWVVSEEGKKYLEAH